MRMLETEKLNDYFLSNDYSIVEVGDKADLVIISGCSVGTVVEENTNTEINKWIESGKKLIITGCVSPEKVKLWVAENKNIDYVSPTNMEKFDDLFTLNTIKWGQVEEAHSFSENTLCEKHYSTPKQVYSKNLSCFSKLIRNKALKQEDSAFNTQLERKNLKKERCFITINTGCILKCSFCNTRNCIDECISKTREKIVEEYSKLLEKGFRDFIFISEDIGSYGHDTGDNLPQLLHSLSNLSKNYFVRWQLDGLNPVWSVKYKEELLPLIRPGMINAITYPAQSGSTRILKLMNRYSDMVKFTENLKQFREKYKLLRLYGVFMIGFPSETEEDFYDTLDFIKTINFDNVSFTSYSEFDQCDSAKIFPKISENEKNQRLIIAKKFFKKINIAVKY